MLQLTSTGHKTVLFWMLVPLLKADNVAEGEYSGRMTQCSSSQQIGIITNKVPCKPHPTMVEIPRPNNTNLLHMIPSHTTVNRCGGSCHMTGHYCNPKKAEMVPVDVILISSSSVSSGMSTLCSSIEVHQDIDCGCWCAISPSECSPYHRFDQSSCRCICKDWKARTQCNQDGRWWDQESCSCKCSPHLYRQCSTGYTYDFGNTCECVPNYMKASLPLFTLIGVAVLGCIILATSVAVYIDKKKIIKARSEGRKGILESQEDEYLEEQ